MSIGIEKIKSFLEQGYKVYIYGTGIWGRNIYQELKKNNIYIDGFVVTRFDNQPKLFDLPVVEYWKLNHKGSVLVLGLNQHNTKEVLRFLQEHDFDEKRIIYSNDVLGIKDARCGYDEIPCLDITTKIGCEVNCKYCPQDILLKAYFKNDHYREKILSLDTLMKCIEHMPDNTNYQFCGMAEPFLNPICYELIS